MNQDIKDLLWGAGGMLVGGLALSCAKDQKDSAERAELNGKKKKALAHRIAAGGFVVSAALDFACAIKTLATANVQVNLWPEKK